MHACLDAIFILLFDVVMRECYTCSLHLLSYLMQSLHPKNWPHKKLLCGTFFTSGKAAAKQVVDVEVRRGYRVTGVYRSHT